MKPKGLWADFPVERINGFDFHRIPLGAYEDRLPRLDGGSERDSSADGDSYVLIPVAAPDDKLNFPGDPSYEALGPFLKSGISAHRMDLTGKTDAQVLAAPARVSAVELEIMDDFDLYFECASVLDAHGWAGRGGQLSDEMVAKVAEVEGPDFAAEAMEEYGEDDWRAYAAEVAARHFARPLSRLWYAANLLSLHYARQDDLRVGYFLAEYRVKMKYEIFALKHLEVIEKNRESGAKGGQAEKKRERYICLDRLARQHFKELAFASDKDAMRLAKRMAAEHDAGADEPLFVANGKMLSRDWFEEWLRHFRQAARGVE